MTDEMKSPWQYLDDQAWDLCCAKRNYDKDVDMVARVAFMLGRQSMRDETADTKPAPHIEENTRSKGLFQKYIITHGNGTPIDPDGDYFVLKLNSQDESFKQASRTALLTFVEQIMNTHPVLAADLAAKLGLAWPLQTKPSSCQCSACTSDQPPHKSDCAVHNMPAYPNGPCSCGAVAKTRDVGAVLGAGSKTFEKSVGNTDVNGARKNVKDIKVFGNGDMFQLLCKASSENEGWMKSSKAMEIPGVGCLVQVTTQQRGQDGSYACAEALQFVPNVKIAGDAVNGRTLVKSTCEMSDKVCMSESPMLAFKEEACSPITLANFASIMYDAHESYSCSMGEFAGPEWSCLSLAERDLHIKLAKFHWQTYSKFDAASVHEYWKVLKREQMNEDKKAVICENAGLQFGELGPTQVAKIMLSHNIVRALRPYVNVIINQE